MTVPLKTIAVAITLFICSYRKVINACPAKVETKFEIKISSFSK